MGRKGGNPLVEKYRFTTDREEPLTEKFTIRVAPSMFLRLQNTPDWREFVRKAILAAFDAEDKAKKQSS